MTGFALLILSGALLLAPTVAPAGDSSKPVFRLHLFSEPTSLSPFVQKNSNSTYFLSQLSCPLLRWSGDELLPWGAVCKTKKKTTVECEIDENLKFNDGTPVLASHYLESFKAFFNPVSPGPRADLLLSVKNAEAVLKKEKPVSDLGIKAQGRRLIFELEAEDADFLSRLAYPLFTAVASSTIPTPSEFKKLKSCGPYQLSGWTPGQRVQLLPNPHFPKGHPDRPQLEFIFVPVDSLALQYYQKGELDFLRRLPTVYFSTWKNKPDFLFIEQIRLDSLQFSETYRDENLTKALAESIDFEAWRKLYHAAPRPGCFGLPAEWTLGPVCWDFKPGEAKNSLAALKDNALLKSLRFFYSKQGGDDHDRTAEFLQNQWKKNLSLSVRLESQENKIFLETLRQNQAPFFRKGLAPERATCLAVLENFTSGHLENYIQFSNANFDQIVTELRRTSQTDRKKSLCREGLLILRDQARLIPTGPISFALLLKPKWRGVNLNNLNHLDLSQLHLTPANSK